MPRKKQTCRRNTGGKNPRKSHARPTIKQSHSVQDPELMRSVYENYTVVMLKELVPREYIQSSRPGKAPLKDDIINSLIKYKTDGV